MILPSYFDNKEEIVSKLLPYTIGDYIFDDENSNPLFEMMKKSYDILVNHPINIERKKQGLNPANCCWFWGAGTKPLLDSFREKTGKKGMMVSAVDLLKGIAAKLRQFL